ncbi:MAG: ComEC/Rec2 family competence protein, partial [Candidatus Bipolaricaulaceae bacterium]
MGRALLPGIAAALGFGLALGHLRPLGPLALAASAFFLLLALWRKAVPLLWLSALFAGMALVRPHPEPPHLAFQLPRLTECTGVVADVPEPTAKRLSFVVDIEALGVRLLAYGPQDHPVFPGQRVRLYGQYEAPEPEGYREYLLRRGIQGLFWADQVEVLEEGPNGLLFWAAQAREKMFRLLSAVPERARALLGALLLGSRGLLSPEEKEAFRQAGVAHLLALSGLHVGILVAGGWGVLGLLRVPKPWRHTVLVPAVALYVLVGGLRVSLVRAALMFGILGVFWLLWERGWVARRWLDPLQGLSFAAILVLLLWPWSALDAAFQLSFSATAGIVLVFPSWLVLAFRRRLPRPLRYFADLLAVSACAQLAVLPFLGSTFGYIAPYGLLANLVLIPWTTVLLWAGFLGLPLLAVPA